ncbi:MAG: NUDIX domain-containing protein [Dehalococcoidia bacterium]
MPEPRFCLHCGTSLAERLVDGEPRVACTTCSYVHFDNPVAVAGVIVRQGAEVLLVRPAGWPGPHVLVSGFLEAYESAEEAAVREVKEETGLDVAIERVLGSYSCRPIGKNMVFIVCVARLLGGELRLSEELAEARWFTLDALPDWPEDWPVARAFADLLGAQAPDGGIPVR